MSKVAVIYFSGSGTTHRLAELLINSLDTTGCEVYEHRLQGSDIVEGRWQNDPVLAELNEADAILFGTPTYMGGVSAQLKSFFDATAPLWYTQSWNGKFTAAFTASAKPAGDKLNCLQDIYTYAMQMGMIWIGSGGGVTDPEGTYAGLAVTASTPDEVGDSDREAAERFGQRIVKILSNNAT